MIKQKYPVCPYCVSEETVPLRNYGKQIGNQFQCLSCKKQWCNSCGERRGIKFDCKCENMKIKLKKKNPTDLILTDINKLISTLEDTKIVISKTSNYVLPILTLAKDEISNLSDKIIRKLAKRIKELE